MLDALSQYGTLAIILFIAGSLIVIFGAMVAGAIYCFIWLHIEAYNWIKNKISEVYNGNIPTDA